MMLFNSQIVYTLVAGKESKPNRDDEQEFIDSLIGTIGVDIESTGTQKYLTPSEAKLVTTTQFIIKCVLFVHNMHIYVFTFL